MAKKVLLTIWVSVSLLFSWFSASSADIGETPELIYCDTESSQLGTQSTPPKILNQLRFGGSYFDQDQNQFVDVPGDRYYQDGPMTYITGYDGATASNEYKFFAEPGNLDVKISNSAHSTLGQSSTSSFGQAAKWYMLTGTSEPVNIRADLAFQGKLYGDFDETGMDARAYFTHGANILRYPTIGQAYRLAILNGACLLPGEACGPFGTAGTIPDFCFECDGAEHLVNKIIRGNPYSILPDIPFSILIWLNATASVNVPEWLTGSTTAYSNWYDPCLATNNRFGLSELTPEGILIDPDGDFATHDEVSISSSGYKLLTLSDTSTRFQATETARAETQFNANILSKTAALDGAVTGVLSGTFVMSDLHIITIESGDYQGKGFFKGQFSATLENVAYTGDWKGMAYFSEADQKIYLKGRLTGKIGGITDGYLAESTPGNGVYDKLYCSISLGEILNEPTSSILDLSGTLNYLGQTQYSGCGLSMIQSTASGEMSGENTGTINLTVTQMRVTDAGNPFFGEGYSYLSYSSPSGTGEGWTYDKVPFTDVHYQRGMLTGAFTGTISLVLDDDRDTHYLAGTIRRVNLGLPPMADLYVSSWTSWLISPGDITWYYIYYSNSGTDTAENAKVILRIAPGLEFLSCTAGGVLDPESNEVVFNIGNMPPKRYKSAYVQLRARWGLSWSASLTNEVFIGCDSLEKEAVLDPANTVMTDEWKQFQVAYGNDYDVRYPPPGYDPNDPNWDDLKETSYRDRTLEAINEVKKYNEPWGNYLEQLYNDGRIHVDPDTYSSSYSNWVGSRHLYVSGDDLMASVGDSRWSERMWSDCWLPILSSKMLHESEHSKQWYPAQENGEIGAFITENTYLLNVLKTMVQSGKIDQAKALAQYMRDYRWKDLKGRDAKWNDAIRISDEMIDQLTDIIDELFQPNPDINDIIAKINGSLTYIKAEAAKLQKGKVHNQSEWTSDTSIAWDPNAIYGPTGCVSPGQRLDYRIEFENVGKGKAFGVYFTNVLPDGLDDATLDIGPVISTQTGLEIAPTGTYDPATRTITWTVGEVGPSQGGEAQFHVNVNGDAPDGTEVIEYATVFFPSVPQMLNTEPAVATVCLTQPSPQAPHARPGGPYVGSTGLNITFDARGSYDLDGSILKYEWDWDGNGTYDQNTTNPVIDHKWDSVTSGMVGLKVTDDDGLTDEATADLMIQDIGITVYIDINPGGCPNPLNLKKKGEIPVAILGTDTLDVTALDPSTIRLSRDSITCSVPPVRWSYADAATPFDGDPCACRASKRDGHKDLVLKFDTQEVINCLALSAHAEKSIELMITGNLKTTKGGNPFIGRDCIKLIKK
jgi:hypothetical protein